MIERLLMIFQNTDKDKLPDSKEIGRVLAMMQDKIPVRHMMPFERMVGDEDAYILTRLSNGRFSIKPNITHQGMLYYGNCDFESVKDDLKPHFYKKDDEGNAPKHDDFMESNVLLEQFRMLVETFPLYRLLNEGIRVDERLTIKIGNPYGLASTYGLKAPYMNLTSDIDVAMFYATHKYDEKAQQFVAAEEGSIGIIYTYAMPLQFGMIPGLSTLGKQVFPRTFHNRQFLLGMNRTDDFNKNKFVNGFTFRQTTAGSELYERIFGNGEMLIPKDDFLIKKWQSYSKRIFKEAIVSNLRHNPHDDMARNIATLQGREYEIAEGMPTFTKEDIMNVDLYEIWENICDDLVAGGSVRYRGDIENFLEQVPSMDKYKSYFNVNLYYEE